MNYEGWKFRSVVAFSDGCNPRGILNPYLCGEEASSGDEAAVPLAVIPEYINDRIRAQRGAFIMFAEQGNALETLIEADAGEEFPFGRPIVIPRSDARNLSRELQIAGVDTAPCSRTLEDFAPT